MTALATAERYFALSNARDLDAIEALFMEDATYSSDNTGLYFGRQDIMVMVRAFFAGLPQLHWQIVSAQQLSDAIVEIRFKRSAVNADGEDASGEGIERVVVVEGRIRHVEVRRL